MDVNRIEWRRSHPANMLHKLLAGQLFGTGRFNSLTQSAN